MIARNIKQRDSFTPSDLVKIQDGMFNVYLVSPAYPPTLADRLIREFVKLESSVSESNLEADAHDLGKIRQSHIGRAKIAVFHEPGLNPLCLRLCRRGGLVAKITKRSFFKTSDKPRALSEIETLLKLRAAGFLVPKPVAALVRPGLFSLRYRAAVVTESILGAENLLALIRSCDSRTTGENLFSICREVGVLAQKLLIEGIYHPDLHLGNVLLDQFGSIFLIDFDKSSLINESQYKHFQNKLIERWSRSVRKHLLNTNPGKADLAQIAIEQFRQGLMSKCNVTSN